MLALVERITRAGGITRAEVRKTAPAKPQRGRPKSYVFRYAAPSKAFKLQLNFRKSKVGKSELIQALEDILEDLRSQ